MEREIKKAGLTHAALFKPEYVELMLKKYGFGTVDDMYSAIGYGGNYSGLRL